MSLHSVFTISVVCISLFFLWKYLKFSLVTEILNHQESQLNVFAKEIWRLRTFQSIHMEKQQHQNFSEHVQRAYHEIQRHHDYSLVEYGFRKLNETEFKEQIWIFSEELPSEIDFEDLKKLNNHQYSRKRCKVKAGNKVKSIQRLQEDEGEMDSMIKEIEVVSVVKRPTIESDSFLVTFDLGYYGKREFIFYSFGNRYFKFIED